MQPIPAAPPPPADLALEAFLPYRLSVLSNRISTAIAQVYARRYAMTIPEWRLMAVLGRFGPMSAMEVGERTAMDKVRVSRAVQRLLTAGRLERATDAGDRRRSVLRLSGLGRAVHAEIAPLALAIERELLAPLGGEERAALERGLAALERSAGAFLKGKAPVEAVD